MDGNFVYLSVNGTVYYVKYFSRGDGLIYYSFVAAKPDAMIEFGYYLAKHEYEGW